MTTEHPIQPTEFDSRGVLRFKRNSLVRALSEHYGLNELHLRFCNEPWFQDDYDQLMQLIGYSVAGAPISDKCNGRVQLAKTNTEPTFSEGYDDGWRDALSYVRDELDALERNRNGGS